MTHREILDLIFLPGFSTAEKDERCIRARCGHGCGPHQLKKLNGIVELDSEVGRRYQVTLKLPFTLAILPVARPRRRGNLCLAASFRLGDPAGGRTPAPRR